MKKRISYIFLSLIALSAILLYFYWPRQSKYAKDPTLVATKRNNPIINQVSPVWARPVFFILSRLDAVHMTYTFSPTTNRMSIEPILTQCHEASGTRFFIDKQVAAGTVNFGFSTNLNGPQYVAAFTNVLQTGKPEWFDSATKKMRHENLVLLPVEKNAYLVLPPERVSEFSYPR